MNVTRYCISAFNILSGVSGLNHPSATCLLKVHRYQVFILIVSFNVFVNLIYYCCLSRTGAVLPCLTSTFTFNFFLLYVLLKLSDRTLLMFLIICFYMYDIQFRATLLLCQLSMRLQCKYYITRSFLFLICPCLDFGDTYLLFIISISITLYTLRKLQAMVMNHASFIAASAVCCLGIIKVFSLSSQPTGINLFVGFHNAV